MRTGCSDFVNTCGTEVVLHDPSSNPLALQWQRREAPRRWKPRRLSFKPARASRSLLCVCDAAAGLARRKPGGAGRRACMGANGPARREKQRSCVLCGWSAAWLLPGSWPPRDMAVLSAGGCARLAACSPTCYAWSRAPREYRGLRVRVCVCLPTVNGRCSLDVKFPYTLSQNPKP
jgi:hypothetical protein